MKYLKVTFLKVLFLMDGDVDNKHEIIFSRLIPI